MSIKRRLSKLEYNNGMPGEEEPIHIGKELTSEKKDSIIKAVYGSTEKTTVIRESGEPFDVFEKRILRQARHTWAYFYSDVAGSHHVFQAINMETSKNDRRQNAY